MSSERVVLKNDHPEDERELLRLLLEKEGVRSQGWEIAQADYERLPLSYAQKRLWFLDRLQPGSDFYNVGMACELHGKLDVQVLERSLQEIIRRHGALRTRFVAEDGEPVQKVEARIDLRLQLLDLADQNGAEIRRKRAEEIVAQEAAKPFDLSSAPLLRGVLIRLGDREHILGLTFHHIVMDEWSLGVFQQEMELLYAAYVQGQASPLKEMPVQYADYTLWQAQWLKGEVFVRQMEYWKNRLAGMPEVLDLPTDKPRPATTQHRGSTEARAIEPELWEKMKQLSRQEGASPFMTLLAIYEVLLLRYTGQADFGVGTAIANRNHVRAEGVIGFCLNTLILRADLEGEPTFRKLLERVRKTALEAYGHQELPLEKLVEELSPERRVSGSPLFQVMFTLMSGTTVTRDLSGLEMGLIPVQTTTSKYDLTLISADHEVPGVAFNYDAGLFEAETIQRMLGHYECLLEAAIADPEVRIPDLAMLTDSETQQLLVDWNPATAEYGQKCVHQLFEEQVMKTPAAVAVAFEEAALTYAELNRRANQLAHYLRMAGVGPDARVAIWVERGLEMVVGLLAALKAGGAYVLLDPSYPAERLQLILEDSAPRVLMAQGDSQRLPGGISTTLRIVDLTEAVAWKNQPETNLDPAEIGLDPECLAYVIYTSGSTGEPKGSEVPHRSIPGFIFGIDYACFDEESVLLQHSSLNWDGLTLELWPALLKGGRSLLARQRVLTTEEIRDYVQRAGINTLWLTAALFNSIAEDDVKCLKGLKYLLTGGEAASVLHIKQALKQLPGTQLVNGYGPSECTVFSNCYVVPRELPEAMISLPIGKPIGDRRVYVLDQWMNLAPIGVVGEAFIGGASVARGYLQRRELTAERFVPDPYSAQAGASLYRTGDLVRWRHDGTIEFIGRNDFQVKVRGFRIELAEIEARLLEYSGVSEAVVVAREDAAGNRILAAYYTEAENEPGRNGDQGGGGSRLRAEELRSHLAQKLPEYMVPTSFVLLEALPLTGNGKLDRKALPAPDGDSFATTVYEEPQGEIESTLAGIWKQGLDIERVGRNDNFFDIGGHSLLATWMIGRLRQALGVEVKLSDVFAHACLKDLARKIEGTRRGQRPPITTVDREQHLRLSYAQQRLWFLAQMKGVSEAYHISVGVRLLGKLDRSALGRALDRVLARHEPLRTTFAVVDGEAVQRIRSADESLFSLQDYDLREKHDGELELQKVLDQEAGTEFDLEAGPLIRGQLVRQAEDEYTLLITMHHIISDGWSMGIFLNELSVLYRAYVKGESDPLPELKVQYADYAVWQRRWMEGEVLKQQGEYWRTTLAGAPALLDLPADHVRPAQQDYAGDWIEVMLDEGQTAELKEFSKRQGTTLYMTLMAGWAALLGRLSGQQDVLIGTPVANRGQAELEGMIGFFVNTLVMRVDLSGRPRPGELLGRVKKQALAAQQNQDIPFEQVVEIVRPERRLAHSPVFQVMFAWQNAPKGKLDLVGLKLARPVLAPHRSAQFDLTLSLLEMGNGIEGGIEYATALFERATIERYIGHLHRMLKAMVTNDQETVDCLAFLPQEERHQVLYEWNLTEAECRPSCVHELFEEQARRSPGFAAVQCQGQELTYQELNRRANQLGHYLRKMGVGPEVRVGVCIERGLEMVA
ncbi:MAG TPA: amino acid adenylation domain-containing protein, partial [Candidatus Angelobacter sp.]